MVKPIVSGPYRTFRALSPGQTFIEFEGSTITIPMKGRRTPSDPWIEEAVQLKAFMRLEVFPPYVNELGTREFQFIIRDWELYGKSEMLTQLFYNDPRGLFVEDMATGFADYVPPAVSFRVSQNYHIEADPGQGIDPLEIFSNPRDIEIRNLTSHHLRVWTSVPQREQSPNFYSYRNNKIYWQVIPPQTREKMNLAFLSQAMELMSGSAVAKEEPLIVFHKKAPGIPGESDDFDLASAQDRARYLLAVSTLRTSGTLKQRGDDRLIATATLPVRGFTSNLVQLPGNSILSSFYRARQPLEIRFALNPAFKAPGDVNDLVSRKISGSTRDKITGWIHIVDPPKSLGTADQAPEPGYPIDSADFPARITYAANYDIFVNNERFVDDQSGIAIAVGVDQIPPRDVKVAFEKPQAGLVLNNYLEFAAGSCTGMEQITEQEFRDGSNFARYWRTVPLAPGGMQLMGAGGGGPIFEDYDPSRTY